LLNIPADSLEVPNKPFLDLSIHIDPKSGGLRMDTKSGKSLGEDQIPAEMMKFATAARKTV